MAVFLMAGVADDVLDWPFQEDIKTELMNQASIHAGILSLIFVTRKKIT